MPPPFRIAIIGGGLGGLFAALSIHHHCNTTATNVEISVYEQASQYREIGNGLGVGINAAKLVHQLGFGSRLNELTGHGPCISYRRYDNGESIFDVPLEVQYLKAVHCARSDLLDLFREIVEERKAATLYTKKACQRLEDCGEIVRVHFVDGTVVEANMVVACDGIHSAVRKQVTTDQPMFSGMVAYRALVPVASISDWPFASMLTAWVDKGRHFIMYPLRDNQILNIVACVTRSEEEVAGVKESWTTVCDRKEVEDTYLGFHPAVQEIIRLMPDRPSKWLINDRRPLEQWHYLGGKVVLLGDAAHAMTPHLGSGTGQAMEDGWVLGRALSDYLKGGDENAHFQSLATTAQLYQDIRLPRAQRIQLASRATGQEIEMQAEGMEDKTYDECCEMMATRMRERYQWIWEEDLDAAYEKYRNGRDSESGTNGSA